MIKHHCFTFTHDKYTELTENHPDLCSLFIQENKEDFLSMIEIISLEKTVFEDLILSGPEDKLFKEKIIKVYGVDLMSKEIAEHVYTFSLLIDNSVFEAAWKILDTQQKKILLFSYLDILQANDFEKYFKELEKPYQELADRSRRHNVTLSKSKEHMLLAKRLLFIDYITSYDDSGYVIRKYDHTLKKMVDSPAILYRIKATSNKDSIK